MRRRRNRPPAGAAATCQRRRAGGFSRAGLGRARLAYVSLAPRAHVTLFVLPAPT
ncbi:hypothetical protein BGLT_07310 [Caballeronia glathei]|nr:hypothetical protein BGLT_07310 [Caballeronia glathei]